MKNDKILNFLIALFVTLIVMNFFLPKNNNKTIATWIVFSSAKTSYTIPNSPVLTINNFDDKIQKINTCKNITITKDWTKIENISKDAPNFCKDLEIKKWEPVTIGLEDLKIGSISWNYVFDLNVEDKKYTVATTQSEKWFFNNFFSTIFYWPVYNLFVLFLSYLPNHSLGLSIIAVTIIIRLLILVPQHKIMVNGRKMQAIQPKIKEIQTKYKWDQSKLWMELLELYKKEWVNPMWSCLPLLIQLPLLMVLYWIVSSITSPDNYYFLYSPFSNFNASIINPQFLWLNLIKHELISAVILAILIWASQWLQIRLSLTFQKKKKDHGKVVIKEVKWDDPLSEFMPDPNMMNAVMQWWMPIMLAFSSYFMPSWVGIYWLIGTIFTIIQQYVANKIADKK